MKKLFLTLAIILTLVFAVTACNGNNGGDKPIDPNDPDHIHSYGEWETTKEASCLETGTKVRRCACLEQESETIPATGHTFDQKNVGDKYLKSGATEDSPALYYFSCRCGEKGADTFSVGNALGGNGDGTHVFRNEWTYDDEKHWRSCIDLSCDARTNEAAHTFGEWVVDEAATCMKTGSKHHACVVCGKSVSETIPIDATAHNYSAAWTTDGTNHWHACQNSGCTSVSGKVAHNLTDGWCRVCYNRNGNYIYFGEYPQTLKADDVTITTTTDSRGYYLGSDGFYYAKVTADPCDSGYTFSSGTPVKDGTVYYFKVEPIRWRILSENGDTAFILCDSIIANKAFDEYNGGNYDNNYADSTIRAWLNDQFYNTAFTGLQKELINTVLVDNSAASTGDGSTPFACEDTNDKIFLLSQKEVTDSAYGFASSDSKRDAANDTARRMTVSDYARATGSWMDTSSDYYGNGYWWLRSPRYFLDEYYIAGRVNYRGNANNHDIVDYGSNGVVPALQIRLR